MRGSLTALGGFRTQILGWHCGSIGAPKYIGEIPAADPGPQKRMALVGRARCGSCLSARQFIRSLAGHALA